MSPIRVTYKERSGSGSRAEFHYIVSVRRSALFRVFSVVLGLWFSTAAPLSAAVHDCPLHGNHAAHAGHHMAGMQQGPGPTKAHHTACTCMGSCCCAAAAAAPAKGMDALPTTARAVVLGSVCDRHIDSSREHALPFSNGPPVLLI